MDWLLYLPALALVKFLQALPLTWVARLGRAGGALACALDARHRRVATDNLTRCFGAEKPVAEIRGLVREHFRRLGETYACAVKTASMTAQEIGDRLQVPALDRTFPRDAPLTSRIFAIGHFGNFELYAHVGQNVPELQFATTYRALKQPALNRLLLRLRRQSGCLYFERRSEGKALQAAVASQRVVLGFLADQHAGDHGTWVPFFGRDCSTNPAPAVFALRYKLPLQVAICYRTGLARWRIEVSEEIPTHEGGQRRSVEAIMRDVNTAYEAGVRRDPVNWFWVHRRWRPRPPPRAQDAAAAHTTASESAPAAGAAISTTSPEGQK